MTRAALFRGPWVGFLFRCSTTGQVSLILIPIDVYVVQDAIFGNLQEQFAWSVLRRYIIHGNLTQETVSDRNSQKCFMRLKKSYSKWIARSFVLNSF